MLRLILCFVVLKLSTFSFASPNTDRDFSTAPHGYFIGVGKADITGPVAERGMLGYGSMHHKSMGLHSRLYARAFAVEKNASLMVFVVADLCFIPNDVKQEVLKLLREQGLSNITNDNLMMMAIHTHSGPGGFAGESLYNLTSLGFSKVNFAIITKQIAKSIHIAIKDKVPGDIFYNEGKLENATVNRSLQAFEKNHEFNTHLTGELKELFDAQSNKQMALLKFVGKDKRDLGLLNWFAIHSTSMPNTNNLVSSDNKGQASLLSERAFDPENNILKSKFVAGFANAEEGDVSPHVHPSDLLGFIETKESGKKQFEKAQELYHKARIPVSNQSNFVSKTYWVDMTTYKLARKNIPFSRDKYSEDNKRHSLCYGALGLSFAAGSTLDGPSRAPGFTEGMLQGDNHSFMSLPWFTDVLRPFLSYSQADASCHAPKPILLSTNLRTRDLTARVLPFQVSLLGQLALLAVPGEMTTMAGYQLKQMLSQQLHKMGIQYVVIAGLSNSYSGYITTTEEYNVQRYEGAHTLFGPYTLDAYIQIFSELLDSLQTSQPLSQAPIPHVSTQNLVDLQTGVVYDTAGMGKDFGDVRLQPKASYKQGESVVVKFQAAHPNNLLPLHRSYFEIQKLNNGAWETVLTDVGLGTYMKWKRVYEFGCFAGCSEVEITWQPDEYTTEGKYRIVHQGYYKAAMRRNKFVPYAGVTDEFNFSQGDSKVHSTLPPFI